MGGARRWCEKKVKGREQVKEIEDEAVEGLEREECPLKERKKSKDK